MCWDYNNFHCQLHISFFSCSSFVRSGHFFPSSPFRTFLLVLIIISLLLFLLMVVVVFPVPLAFVAHNLLVWKEKSCDQWKFHITSSCPAIKTKCIFSSCLYVFVVINSCWKAKENRAKGKELMVGFFCFLVNCVFALCFFVFLTIFQYTHKSSIRYFYL